MKDIIVSVSRETRMVNVTKNFLGNDGENLQGNIVFQFIDEFVNGVARLEYVLDSEEKYIMLTKEDDKYIVPIKSVLTKEGHINMQLVITENDELERIPVFKSNIFYVYCNKSINAEIEQPDEYPTWIEIANAKINEIDRELEKVKDFEAKVDTLEEDLRETDQKVNNLDIEVGKISDGINELARTVGENTDDINTLEQTTIRLGNEIREQEDNINHLDDVKADRSEIPDVTKFVQKTTSDLVNYYTKNETYTQSEVNQLIGAIKTVSMKIVPERPTTGEANIIYFVPSKKSKVENIYEEYIYANNKWELIGTTDIDLSDYYTKEEISTLLFDYITSNDLEEVLNDYITITKFNNEKYNYVKDGLLNNTNELSDEEKLKIESWLGLDENYLTYYNATPYQVNGDYVPAHKKYVDEKIGDIATILQDIDTGSGV